jgi:hypothetical protein
MNHERYCIACKSMRVASAFPSWMVNRKEGATCWNCFFRPRAFWLIAPFVFVFRLLVTVAETFARAFKRASGKGG